MRRFWTANKPLSLGVKMAKGPRQSGCCDGKKGYGGRITKQEDIDGDSLVSIAGEEKGDGRSGR